MSEEFKRCPFCGSEAKIWARDGSDGDLAIFGSRKMVRIKCPNCFCDIQVTENCFEDVVTFDEMLDYALEQWNTRNTSTCKNMNGRTCHNIKNERKWYFDGQPEGLVCSECEWDGGIVTRRGLYDIKPNYCPNCGAKVVCEE